MRPGALTYGSGLGLGCAVRRGLRSCGHAALAVAPDADTRVRESQGRVRRHDATPRTRGAGGRAGGAAPGRAVPVGRGASRRAVPVASPDASRVASRPGRSVPASAAPVRHAARLHNPTGTETRLTCDFRFLSTLYYMRTWAWQHLRALLALLIWLRGARVPRTSAPVPCPRLSRARRLTDFTRQIVAYGTKFDALEKGRKTSRMHGR